MDEKPEKKRRPLAEEGSLEHMAANNPELQKRLREGRMETAKDQAAMEKWAKSGFQSTGGDGDDDVQ